MSKAKGMIFTAESVQAILSGTKTQTRRVIKPQPEFKPYKNDTFGIPWWEFKGHRFLEGKNSGNTDISKFAKCQIGDIIYVRETWRPAEDGYTGQQFGGYWYKASSSTPEYNDNYNPWRSPMYMPKAVARIFLRVIDVRAERLLQISEADAIAEGIMDTVYYQAIAYSRSSSGLAVDNIASCAYALHWDEINGKKKGCSWEDNPFVWVYEFTKLERNEINE